MVYSLATYRLLCVGVEIALLQASIREAAVLTALEEHLVGILNLPGIIGKP